MHLSQGCSVANAHNQLVANKLFSGLNHPDKLESYQHRYAVSHICQGWWGCGGMMWFTGWWQRTAFTAANETPLLMQGPSADP